MFNTLLEVTTETVTEPSGWEKFKAWFSDLGSNLGSWAVNDALPTALRVVIAIVVLLVTFRIITVIARKIEKKGEHPKFDKTIMRVFAYVFKIGMRVIIVVCLVGFLGFDTSGLTALIASLGVCFGLAVNGAVANIAGGVLILFTRPFKVDDYIEAQGQSGTVEDIYLVSTKLRTPDNKVVYLPNGALANGNIVNYSVKDIRRVDFSFSISYSDDFETAKGIVTKILEAHELVLDDPAIFVRVSEHGASSVVITARAWTKTDDYWTVHFDVIEAVKTEFDKNGITIPFNQLDVHVKKD